MPFLHCHKNRESWLKWAEEQSFRTGWRHKIFYPKGGYYKGDWLRGRQTGKGVELLPNGLQYEGDWLNNSKHGFGIRSQYDPNEKIFHLVYLGDYKNNKMHGYGCLHYPNGTFYEGEFKNDKRHGFGRCWFFDNSYYEGYWMRDKEDGFGMLVQANGNRYEGQWADGKKDGWGTYYHLDSGQVQTGFWEKDCCTKSTMEDMQFRQSALSPTKYPIPKTELDLFYYTFLPRSDEMISRFNEGCELHKYCYKASRKSPEISPKKSLVSDND